jgi:hypothetical protein
MIPDSGRLIDSGLISHSFQSFQYLSAPCHAIAVTKFNLNHLVGCIDSPPLAQINSVSCDAFMHLIIDSDDIIGSICLSPPPPIISIPYDAFVDFTFHSDQMVGYADTSRPLPVTTSPCDAMATLMFDSDESYGSVATPRPYDAIVDNLTGRDGSPSPPTFSFIPCTALSITTFDSDQSLVCRDSLPPSLVRSRPCDAVFGLILDRDQFIGPIVSAQSSFGTPGPCAAILSITVVQIKLITVMIHHPVL